MISSSPYHPIAPSIDRRLSAGGYAPDNVRLVCVAVNFGLGQWGDEVFLSLARAAADFEKQKATALTVSDWHAQQLERIAAAEKILSILPAEKRSPQVRHIAGLKRALTMGPAGLAAAAEKAHKS